MNELTEISELIFMNARKAADLFKASKACSGSCSRRCSRAETKGTLERIAFEPLSLEAKISVNVEGPELITTVHAGLSRKSSQTYYIPPTCYQGRGAK